MSNDVVKWLGTGMLTAGLTAAMLAGAGAAAAEDESGSDSAGTTSSQSAQNDDSAAGQDADSGAPQDDPPAADDEETGADVEPGTAPAEETTPAESDDESGTAVEDEDATGSSPPIAEAPRDASDTTAAAGRADRSEPTAEDMSVEAFSTVAASQPPDVEPPTVKSTPQATLDPPISLAAPAAPATPAATTFDLPTGRAAAVAAVPPPVRSPIEILGTIVLNLLTAIGRLLDPPPVTPPPSPVRIGRTTLVPDEPAVAREAAAEQAVAEQAAEVAAPLLPGATNGVTGVQVGHSRLAIPGAFIGDSVAADWYFPTQADGTVDAQGVIWMQHGFGATNTFYSALAKELAVETNSIVVAPTLSSIPFTFSGGCLICAPSQQAASAALLDPDRTALINSAQAAGYTGPTDALTGKFVLAGHSAGGGFATAVASDYLNDGTDAQDAELAGVMMFDGVSNGAMDGSFSKQVNVLKTAGKPIYQIAAPAQAWNAFGATTNALLGALPGQFAGVVLVGGSHVDAMLGVNPLFDLVLQLVTSRVPTGNTAAVYTLSTGWINDMYVGATPLAPQYGFYAAANQQIIMGPTAALALPSPVANQLSFGDKVLTTVIDAVGGLFGFSILPTPANTGSNGLDPEQPVARPVYSNGVTGVRTGTAVLDIPCGDNGYAAPATWYFPTQADGTVAPNGVVWLQHGFLGFNPWYSDMAQTLAQETNSIVVAPTIFWFDTPLCPGCYLGGEAMREAAASMFSGSRSALTVSANAAGLQGPLPEKFVLTGHSAGGNFATAVGALITETDQADNLLGVVMFDGVSRAPLFTDSLEALDAAQIPDYQISAPPQQWNAWDVTTESMVATYPDRFNGLQIIDGSHTDVIAGDSLFAQLAEFLSAIVVRPSPPGAKAAVRTLATGWINDIYAGNTTYSTNPAHPLYGVYGPEGGGPQDYSGGDQDVVMGDATASTLPSPPPVTVDAGLPPTENYLGTWYEQGSVRQFFSIGLVNTKAQYGLNPDGSIRVENSGYYFSPNGLKSTIVGSAVPVNASNTRLNVGFFGRPNAAEPGNYWILDYAPDYSWAIVSDPSRLSGYLLTRDQIISDTAYDQLVDRAKQLGVRGLILRTRQFPTDSALQTAPSDEHVLLL
jgi:lipocalin